jgi:hypothetical protein
MFSSVSANSASDPFSPSARILAMLEHFSYRSPCGQSRSGSSWIAVTLQSCHGVEASTCKRSRTIEHAEDEKALTDLRHAKIGGIQQGNKNAVISPVAKVSEAPYKVSQVPTLIVHSEAGNVLKEEDLWPYGSDDLWHQSK